MMERRELLAEIARIADILTDVEARLDAILVKSGLSGPASWDTPLDSIDMSTRSRGCLGAVGCKTAGDARMKSDAELLRIPNFGAKSLREVRALTGSPAPHHVKSVIDREALNEHH